MISKYFIIATAANCTCLEMEIYNGQFIHRQIIITPCYAIPLLYECAVLMRMTGALRSNIKENPPGLLYNWAFIILVMSAFCLLWWFSQSN